MHRASLRTECKHIRMWSQWARTIDLGRGGLEMTKKKPKKGPKGTPPAPIIVRVPPSMYEAIQEGMALLNCDMANLLRMMISEQSGAYIARGKKGAKESARAREATPEEVGAPQPSGEPRRFLSMPG